MSTTMLVFFGIYTFTNPDDTDCYVYTDNFGTTSVSQTEVQGSVDVGRQF